MGQDTKKKYLPNPQAAKYLGCSIQTLKKNYGNPKAGFLKENTHWKRGIYNNSSIAWDIKACKTNLL